MNFQFLRLVESHYENLPFITAVSVQLGEINLLHEFFVCINVAVFKWSTCSVFDVSPSSYRNLVLGLTKVYQPRTFDEKH